MPPELTSTQSKTKPQWFLFQTELKQLLRPPDMHKTSSEADAQCGHMRSPRTSGLCIRFRTLAIRPVSLAVLTEDDLDGAPWFFFFLVHSLWLILYSSLHILMERKVYVVHYSKYLLSNSQNIICHQNLN